MSARPVVLAVLRVEELGPVRPVVVVGGVVAQPELREGKGTVDVGTVRRGALDLLSAGRVGPGGHEHGSDEKGPQGARPDPGHHGSPFRKSPSSGPPPPIPLPEWTRPQRPQPAR